MALISIIIAHSYTTLLGGWPSVGGIRCYMSGAPINYTLAPHNDPPPFPFIFSQGISGSLYIIFLEGPTKLFDYQ